MTISEAATATAKIAGPPTWRDARAGEHFVQFYDDDRVLLDSVRDFVRTALDGDGNAIVIATHDHIDALLRRWQSAGIDIATWVAREKLLLLDAEQTLASFMDGDMPRLDRFMATVGAKVTEAAKRGQRLVAFGEMVALLWNRGLNDATVELERYWNLLANEHAFTLFCAYPVDRGVPAGQIAAYAPVCCQHDTVIVPDGASEGMEHAAVAVARLRQRARVLETEISRRKEDEEGLALLASIVANSDDAIVSKTLEGIIRSWNAGAERIFGYRAEEIVGKPITTIIPPELQHEEKTILSRIRRGERLDHFETIRITKAGKRIPISLTISPVRNSRGEIIGASKIARDISERRLAEGAVRASQRALAAEAEALARLNNWSSRLWRCRDIKEGLDEMLAAVVEMLGADKGYVRTIERRESGSKLVTAAHLGFTAPPGFLDSIARTDALPCLRALTERQRIVVHDVDADPDHHAMRAGMQCMESRAVVAMPLLDPNGAELGALCVFFRDAHRPDLQDLRRLDLYARQAGDFIQRCEFEEALHRNEETLRENDRRKDEFLAVLAHELRNPLAPIRFAAAINQRATATSAHARADAIIERQVRHMSRLLDDLLDASRITRGSINLHRSAANFADIIAAAVETARPAIDAKQHEFSCVTPPVALRVDGDSVRLAQVFSNLLINAAKYTPPHGRIELRAEANDNDIVVTVKDSGVGIEADMIPRLFTLFAQARSSLTNAEGGLGIGLALVRALVELHGGQVEVKSEGIGRGSEFRVRLPILLASTRQAARPEPRRSSR